MSLSSKLSQPLPKVNCDNVQKNNKNDESPNNTSPNSAENLILYGSENQSPSNKSKRNSNILKKKWKKTSNTKLIEKYIDYDKIEDIKSDLDVNSSQIDSLIYSQMNSTISVIDNRKLLCYDDGNHDTLRLPLLNKHNSKSKVDYYSKNLNKDIYIFSQRKRKKQVQESIVYDAIYETNYEMGGRNLQMHANLNVPVQPCTSSLLLKEDNYSCNSGKDINLTLESRKNKDDINLLKKIFKDGKCHILESNKYNKNINNEKDRNNYLNADHNLSLEGSNHVDDEIITLKKKKKHKCNNMESNTIESIKDKSLKGGKNNGSIELTDETEYNIALDKCAVKRKKNRNSENQAINVTKLHVYNAAGKIKTGKKKLKKNKTKKNKCKKNKPESLLDSSNDPMYKDLIKIKEEENIEKECNIIFKYNSLCNDNCPVNDSLLFTKNCSNFIDPTIDAIEKIQDSGQINRRIKSRKKKKSLSKLRLYYAKKQEEREKKKERERVIESKRETIICKYYSKMGSCNKGDKCTYKHEKVKIDEPCKYYMVNSCSKFNNCQYYHNEWPCKFFHIYKFCGKGDSCRFSHDLPNPLTVHLFEKIQQEVQLQNQNKSQNLNGNVQSQSNLEAFGTSENFYTEEKLPIIDKVLPNHIHSDFIENEVKNIMSDINFVQTSDKIQTNPVKDSVINGFQKYSCNFYGTLNNDMEQEHLKLNISNINSDKLLSNSLLFDKSYEPENNFKPLIHCDIVQRNRLYRLIKLENNENYHNNSRNIFCSDKNIFQINNSLDPRLQSCKYHVQSQLRNEPIIFKWEN